MIEKVYRDNKIMDKLNKHPQQQKVSNSLTITIKEAVAYKKAIIDLSAALATYKLKLATKDKAATKQFIKEVRGIKKHNPAILDKFDKKKGSGSSFFSSDSSVAKRFEDVINSLPTPDLDVNQSQLFNVTNKDINNRLTQGGKKDLSPVFKEEAIDRTNLHFNKNINVENTDTKSTESTAITSNDSIMDSNETDDFRTLPNLLDTIAAAAINIKNGAQGDSELNNLVKTEINKYNNYDPKHEIVKDFASSMRLITKYGTRIEPSTLNNLITVVLKKFKNIQSAIFSTDQAVEFGGLINKFKFKLESKIKNKLTKAIILSCSPGNRDVGNRNSLIKNLHHLLDDPATLKVLNDKTKKSLMKTLIESFSQDLDEDDGTAKNKNLADAAGLMIKYASWLDEETLPGLIEPLLENFSNLDTIGEGSNFKFTLGLLAAGAPKMNSRTIKAVLEPLIPHCKEINNLSSADNIKAAVDLIALYEPLIDEDEKDALSDLVKTLIVNLCGKDGVGNVAGTIQAVALLNTYSSKLNHDTFSSLVDTLTSSNLEFDLCFNHLNNHETGSILTAINSRNDQNSKIKLMEQVVTYLADKDVSTIAECLEETLYNDTYLQNQAVSEFTIAKLLNKKMENAKIQVVTFKDAEISILLKHIYTKSKDEDLMLKHSSLINQMIYLGRQETTNKELQIKLKQLETDYLNNDKFKAINEALELNCEEDYFIFTAENGQTLVISDAYYKLFISKESTPGVSVNPTEAYFFDADNKIKLLTDPAATFEIFKIFKPGFQLLKNVTSFPKLVDALGLDVTIVINHKDYPDDVTKNTTGNCKEIFNKALNQTKFDGALTSAAAENLLADLFGKLVEGGNDIISLIGEAVLGIKLTDQHFDAVLAAYGLNETDSSSQKAQIVLCLSAFLSKYSSSYFFGTEFTSPQPIRNYALALLNKALELDPTIINEPGLTDDWKNRLSGSKGAFSCTAVLSSNMIKAIKEKYADTFNSMFP